MATGKGVNQGKTAFLEEFLAGHREATEDEINQTWQRAGHEDKISGSLIYKIRSRLGLTGKRGGTATESVGNAPEPTRANPRVQVEKSSGAVDQAPPVANGSPAPSGAGAMARHAEDEDVLDELEESIDELIQRLRELGGRPDVVKALRRARRLLVRSHEG